MRVRASAVGVPALVLAALCVRLVFFGGPRVLRVQVTTTSAPPPRNRFFVTVPSSRHATKSLAQLGPMDELNPYVVFFNRVPKSGSEVLLILIQWLQGWNNFRHVRLKDEAKRMDLEDQRSLADVVRSKTRDEAVPLCFDKSVHFVNFTALGEQSPTFIGFIRDPVDNFIARYQFLLTTSNPLDRYYNTIIQNKLSIDKCLLAKKPDCYPIDGDTYDFPMSYFCGNAIECGLHNSKWALNQAKENVDKYYSVVGVLEELNTTLAVFEKKLPYFFKGVQVMYYKDLLEQYHIDTNKRQLKVTKFAKQNLRKLLKLEYEFYDWVKSRLFKQIQL